MILPPLVQRDFSRGVIRQSAVSDFLVPDNSVSGSLNVNFDEIIGSAVVRKGTIPFSTTVAIGYAPLGLTTFSTSSLTTNVVVGVFKGASNASLYWFNTTNRKTSNLTALSNTAKNRFAQLGNRLFQVNGTDAMKSTSGGTTWDTTNCMTTRVPSLIIATKARLLTSGDPSYKGRIWFSSIIDPSQTPTITWNEDASIGDFIDVNPDDGDGDITAFSETATLTLAFKSNAMYRVDAVAKTVDPDNIFNIGAVSQEAVTVCQGITYFFSGKDIRRTNGDYPEQISRLGCQDFIDAIPQANWSSVSLWHDDFNVYASIGDVTLNDNQNNETTYVKMVLKFSVRDNTWSIHSYAQKFLYGTELTNTSGRTVIVAEESGKLQTLNSGFTDNGTSIFFELISQDLEFGSRSHTKKISDKFVVFSRYGGSAGIQIQADDNQPKDIVIDLNDTNAVGKNINFEGNKFLVRWYGNSIGQSPVFEGFEFPSISDEGISK